LVKSCPRTENKKVIIVLERRLNPSRVLIAGKNKQFLSIFGLLVGKEKRGKTPF